MKKHIFLFGILLFFPLNVHAGCNTGNACSISDLEKQILQNEQNETVSEKSNQKSGKKVTESEYANIEDKETNPDKQYPNYGDLFTFDSFF